VTGGSPTTAECAAAAGAAAVWEEGTDEGGTASSKAGDDLYDIVSGSYYSYELGEGSLLILSTFRR
jgi:hypothetical protein